MKRFIAAALLLAGLGLSGCGGSQGSFLTGFAQPTPTPGPLPQAKVNFDPASGNLANIPFPNDILRNPANGFNALPAANPTSEPQASFNSIQGFSTAGTISVPFVGFIDPTTVTPANVLVLDTGTNKLANVTLSVINDGNGNSIINIVPTVPLNPGDEFVVIVTNKVLTAGDEQPLAPNQTVLLTQQATPLVDSNGNSLVTGLSNTDAQTLEGIRLALVQVWAAAEKTTGTNRSQIPVAFSFGTESEFTTLAALQAHAAASTPQATVPQPSATLSGTPFVAPTVVPNPLTATSSPSIAQFTTAVQTAEGNAAFTPPTSHIAKVFFGSFVAPNFQNVPTGQNPTGFFVQPTPGGLPTQFGTNTINFIACLPANATAVPAVIFQHGFQRTNLDVLDIADKLCSQGQGVIAINLVLHGDRGIPGQASGTGFVNLAQLRIARDNIRQSISDQDTLVQLIKSGNTTFGGQTAVFQTSPVQYLSQSLGSIVGTITVSENANIPTAVLNVPGGRLMNLILNSQAFSGLLTGPTGLPAFGIQPGTAQFNQFIYIAQTVVDDADPFNYAPHLLNRNLAGNAPVGVLIQEMLGDAVVPNVATNDLALAADINQVNPVQQISTPPNTTVAFSLPDVIAPFTGSGLFQFQHGEHGFLLAPSATDPTGIDTFEGQQQAGTYLLTALTQNGIGTIIAPTPPPGLRTLTGPIFGPAFQHPESLLFFGH